MEMNMVDIIDNRTDGKEHSSVLAKRKKRHDERKSKKSESGTVNPVTESIRMSS